MQRKKKSTNWLLTSWFLDTLMTCNIYPPSYWMSHCNCTDVECIIKTYGTDYLQYVYHLSCAPGLECYSILDCEYRTSFMPSCALGIKAQGITIMLISCAKCIWKPPHLFYKDKHFPCFSKACGYHYLPQFLNMSHLVLLMMFAIQPTQTSC